ncbi:MAG: glycosyltransferase family 9 protein [Candidatus Omnitrophota bacterium]
MKKQNIKKILIFGHSNIGDICYDMVVVNPLRNAFPQAKISFITSPNGVDIANTVKGIDQIIVFDKHGKDKGLWGYLRFMAMIRKEKFDFSLILRDVQMHYFFNIPNILKFKKNSYPNQGLHLAQKYLKFLESQEIKARKPEFDFKFSDNDLQYADDIFKQNSAGDNGLRIGIMPLAAWPLKCWPIDNWNLLIEKLVKQMQAKVFLFGRTGSSDWDKGIKQKLSPKAISLIDQTTMSQSMALLKSLDIFIGADTSLLHLASCMGIETIGLYGATDPDFIYPLFHKQNIVLSKAKLKCLPCYPGPEGGSCKANEPAECMQAISCDQVWQKITEVINRQQNKRHSKEKA